MKMLSFLSLAVLLFINNVNTVDAKKSNRRLMGNPEDEQVATIDVAKAAENSAEAPKVQANNQKKDGKTKSEQTKAANPAVQKAVNALSAAVKQFKPLFKQLGITDVNTFVKELQKVSKKDLIKAINAIDKHSKEIKKLDPKNTLKTSGTSALFPSLIALSIAAVALFV